MTGELKRIVSPDDLKNLTFLPAIPETQAVEKASRHGSPEFTLEGVDSLSVPKARL